VIFVHGLGGSARTWDQLRAVAGDGYAGIAVDLLGFGRSPKPADEAYDIDCHLRHLLREVPDGAIVVGHSAGALLALALAARAPERVAGLVLCSLPAYPDAETARNEIARLGLVARLTVADSWAARAMCWIMCRTRWIGILVAPLFAWRTPAAVARDALRHTYTSYAGTLRHVIVEHRVTDDFARVTVPMVIVHGRDDDVVRLGYVREAAPLGPLLMITPGDHYLPIRNPRACAAALTRVVDAVRGTRGKTLPEAEPR